jgi:hypothetical protein
VSDQDQSALRRLDVESAIESWWGAKLDNALVDHMLAAATHLAEFFDFLLTDADRGSLGSAGKGVLRPLIIDSAADATLSGNRSGRRHQHSPTWRHCL